MIESLPERVAALPDDLRRACEQIFFINRTIGHAIPPAAMEAWVARQFGAAGAVRDQTIVNVTNRLTLESALFNPLRARRPSQNDTDDAALEAWITRELAEYDIFRDPERDTTADVFGRIRGRFCVTASNVAKYEGWHGLVIFDEPHPLRFGPEQVADYFDTALRWIAAAHAHDPQAIYPIVTWNCLPKSGATIMHGHMQVALARGMPYARVEAWRRAAAAYYATHARSYFGDLFAIHAALGLAIPHDGGTRTFAHLAAARNREMIFLAEKPPDTEEPPYRPLAMYGGSSVSAPVGALFETIAFFLGRLIDTLGTRAFNLALILPPLGRGDSDWRDMPIVARIGDRGNPLANRGDVGAMELFASGCITADPFEVATLLRTK